MKVGFIGLGIMGCPMAKHIVQAGYPLMVSDLNPVKVKELTDLGATAGTQEEIARSCEIIEMILPNANIVKQVLFGEQGIAQYMAPGTLVIDHSSVTASDSRECYSRLQERGIHFLDAPVSGGETGAVAGTLTVMVGGDREDFEKSKELFECFDSADTYIGGPGAGSIAKLVNQIICNCNIAIVAEALTFAKKAGVDPTTVYEAVLHGYAYSTVLEDKGPRMIARNFEPSATVEVVTKDIKNVLHTAEDIGCPVPFTAMLYDLEKSLKANGNFHEDTTSFVKYFERLANVTVGEE